MGILDRRPRLGEGKRHKRLDGGVDRINALEAEMENLSPEELRAQATSLRGRAGAGEALDDLLFETFALVREAGRRSLGFRQSDAQLTAGIAMHRGLVVEMGAGEGKTLAMALPVVLNALTDRGVHVISANEHLARRDAQRLGSMLAALGTRAGVLRPGDSPEERRAAYAADVTYGINAEFGFDYLRDHLALTREEQVQPGGRESRGSPHHCAIVDDADAVLLDGARAPLVVSGEAGRAGDLRQRFARLASGMELGVDYEVDSARGLVSVTDQGVAKAERFLGVDRLYAPENNDLNHYLLLALRAQALYESDVQYVVTSDGVEIIDERTGRIVEGRCWPEGIQQAVEAKEGLSPSGDQEILATISQPGYFRLYEKLAGVTSTARAAEAELREVYGLRVVDVPADAATLRRDQVDQIYHTTDGRWTAVAAEIAERHDRGQPVLVGTISVEAAELLAERLTRRGVGHSVLSGTVESASRDAEAIADAGAPGAVTIAANMAGRGVDIPLGGNPAHLSGAEYDQRRAQAVDAGGLYVCGVGHHESRRLDEQLRGRAGRRGDPGESRFFVSAQDDLVRRFANDRLFMILERLPVTNERGEEEPVDSKMLASYVEKAQAKVDEECAAARRQILDHDELISQQRMVIYGYRDRVLNRDDLHGEILERVARIDQQARERYMERAAALGPDLTRAVERYLLRDIIDRRWREYLRGLDRLRESARNLDDDASPAYDDQTRELADELLNGVWVDLALTMSSVDVGDATDAASAAGHYEAAEGAARPARITFTGGEPVGSEEAIALASAGAAAVDRPADREAAEDGDGASRTAVKTRHVATDQQLGRNDPCWCGSGKKFKKCHGA